MENNTAFRVYDKSKDMLNDMPLTFQGIVVGYVSCGQHSICLCTDNKFIQEIISGNRAEFSLEVSVKK